MPQYVCLPSAPLSQASLIALLAPSDPVRGLLQGIPSANWSVTSFNPKSASACVLINNGKAMVNITVSFINIIIKYGTN
jgi:hypothetical protein